MNPQSSDLLTGLDGIGDTGPSLVWPTIRMLLFVALVAVAAWAWFRYQRNAKAGNRQLQVLDRAFLARGTSVALLRVEDRRLLIGVSPEGVRLLRDLDAGVNRKKTAEFSDVLNEAAEEVQS